MTNDATIWVAAGGIFLLAGAVKGVVGMGLPTVAMGLLASGALGNLYDRLFDRRGVTDMFWFRAINFPVFNVADACITVATIRHPWNEDVCATEDVVCADDWPQLAVALQPFVSARRTLA